MCSPSLKGQDMRQRPDSARLATEIDVPALDRSRELIVAQGQRAGAKARKETFNQSWDDCKSLGSLLLSLAIKEANHLRLDSVAFCIFSFPLFLDSLAFILESFSLPNFLRSAGYYLCISTELSYTPCFFLLQNLSHLTAVSWPCVSFNCELPENRDHLFLICMLFINHFTFIEKLRR